MPPILRRLLPALGLAICLAGAARAQDADHPADRPMVVGSDFGVAPWMVRGPNGPEGFGVDLMNEIARRLGRPGVEIVDVNFSGLFAALFAKRFEFTANPLNITEERAQRMQYGSPPQPGTSMTEVYPGYGPPGLPGYEDTPHTPRCGG